MELTAGLCHATVSAVCGTKSRPTGGEMSMPRFDVERFRRLLRTRVLGQSCHAFDVLASTNTFLYALGRQGDPEGTIVLADEQTAGRGHGGKGSISPAPANLLGFVPLCPSSPPSPAPIPFALATAAMAG